MARYDPNKTSKADNPSTGSGAKPAKVSTGPKSAAGTDGPAHLAKPERRIRPGIFWSRFLLTDVREETMSIFLPLAPWFRPLIK